MRLDLDALVEYVDRIVRPAREHGFPDWYVRRIESFAPEAPPSIA